MIDLCQWFGKVMKKIYTHQIFLRFFNGERYKGSDNEKNASKHLALRASLLACIDIGL